MRGGDWAEHMVCLGEVGGVDGDAVFMGSSAQLSAVFVQGPARPMSLFWLSTSLFVRGDRLFCRLRGACVGGVACAWFLSRDVCAEGNLALVGKEFSSGVWVDTLENLTQVSLRIVDELEEFAGFFVGKTCSLRVVHVGMV